jgi:hypothetical protein
MASSSLGEHRPAALQPDGLAGALAVAFDPDPRMPSK